MSPPSLVAYFNAFCIFSSTSTVNAKLGKALEALQLCLKLLPPNCREELSRLLTFMALAADAQGIKLDKEVRADDLVLCKYIYGLLFSQKGPFWGIICLKCLYLHSIKNNKMSYHNYADDMQVYRNNLSFQSQME